MAGSVLGSRHGSAIRPIFPIFPIRPISPFDYPGWDARVAACPNASLFHGIAWARVLHDTYGFKPVYFALGAPENCRAGSPDPSPARAAAAELDELGHSSAGAAAGSSPPPALGSDGLAKEAPCFLPFMEVDSWLTGRRGVSLPFTDECEPLCTDAGALREVWEAALEYAKARAWKYLECRGGRPLFGDVPASTSFWGHRLDLRAGEAELFARVESSVRRAVRKAEQSGLTVEFSQNLDAVRTFYDLLCQTRRRHGVPPQPLSFFQNIHRHILAHNHGFVVLARHGSVPVAGAVFFHFEKAALYKFGASDETFQHLRANNRVMWEAIQHCARQGCATLDFGRTSLENEGLRRFKLGWGAQERRIDYVRYDLRADRFVTASDESEGWHTRIFRMLPLPLSRLIGAILYRHVA